MSSSSSYGAILDDSNNGFDNNVDIENDDDDDDDEILEHATRPLVHADSIHSHGTDDTPPGTTNNCRHVAACLPNIGGGDAPQLVRHLSETLSETTLTIRNAQFHLSDDAMNVSDDRIHHIPAAGTATIPSEVANMTKNLIGGGVLSLSRGIALYANDPTACISAVYRVVLLGTVFGYFSLLVAKSCDMSLSATYRECWERTVGHRGGLFVAVLNTLDPLLGIFANASIMSQSLQLLLRGILAIHISVTQSLLLITVFGLLPLCLMKNLAALAPFSALGMAAVVGALVCMTIRYVDGSYEPGGRFYNDIPLDYRPSFGTEIQSWSVEALPFVCMVYTSFDMHYNSPRFYAELKNASIARFAQVSFWSFGITAIIYFSIACVGFLTFGEHANSYILNNYSPKDSLASACRFGVGFCSLVSYPLNFIGVRDNSLDILGITDDIGTGVKLSFFTLFLLSLLTLISCFVTDLGLINSVGGGTTVIFVVFLFPAIMFKEGIKKHPRISGSGDSSDTRWELWLVMSLMVMGCIIGVVGVCTSVVLA